MSSSETAYFQSLGPWLDSDTVLQVCAISPSTLRQWSDTGQVLVVVFGDGQPYYPAWQFRDGAPLSGLERVLAALAPGLHFPETQAAWFLGEAYQDAPETRLELLLQGRAELLEQWATEDSERIADRRANGPTDAPTQPGGPR